MAKSFSVDVDTLVEVPKVSGMCEVIGVQSSKNMDDGNILLVRDNKGREFDVCEAWVKVMATFKKVEEK